MTVKRQPADWSEQTVHGALVRVMRDVEKVGKDSQNVESPDRFMFRGIDAVVNAVGPVLRKHGVIVVPKVLKANIRLLPLRDGGEAVSAGVKVRYRFYGPMGDFIDATVPGEAMDTGDKATNKAMSVAWRTALIQVLAIPTGDPDPDAASYRRGQQDQAAERGQGAGQRQQSQQRPAQGRPGADPREPAWQQIIAKGRAVCKMDADAVRGDFFRWSGGKMINGPIEDVTPELLQKYFEQMHATVVEETPPGDAPPDDAAQPAEAPEGVTHDG